MIARLCCCPSFLGAETEVACNILTYQRGKSQKSRRRLRFEVPRRTLESLFSTSEYSLGGTVAVVLQFLRSLTFFFKGTTTLLCLGTISALIWVVVVKALVRCRRRRHHRRHSHLGHFLLY